MRVGIRNGRRADGHPPWCAVDHRVVTDLAALQRQRRDKGLHHRARLISVGQRTIAQLRAGEFFAVVRVVGRPVGQRQDFAAAGIDHHRPTGLGVVLIDGVLEMAVGQILNLGVQRQPDFLAILRRLHRSDVFDDIAATITDHRTAARPADQALLEGQLDALQSFVVNAGETDDVRSHVTARVIAAVFLFRMDAGQLQGGDAIGRFRRHLALDEDEGLFRGQLAIQLTGRHIEKLGQLALLSLIHVPGIRRNGPDRFHRRRHREQVAVSVDDLAARGRDFDIAQVTRITLFLQEIVIDDLQVEAARHQGQEGRHQQQADGA